LSVTVYLDTLGLANYGKRLNRGVQVDAKADECEQTFIQTQENAVESWLLLRHIQSQIQAKQQGLRDDVHCGQSGE